MRRSADVTPEDRRVLFEYLKCRELTMAEAGRKLDMDRANVLHHCRWMAKAGLLEVVPGTKALYRITEPGRKCLSRAMGRNPGRSRSPRRRAADMLKL